jgi:hypothetical protein
MLSSRRHFRPLVAVALALGLSELVCGADSLARVSPFLPLASAANSDAPSQEAQIELRGIMTSGGSTLFNIYDATLRQSAWTRLDEMGNGFVVRSYDPARDVVTVDYQGRTLALALRIAKVAAATQPIEKSVVLNPAPFDEQQQRLAFAREDIHLRLVAQHATSQNALKTGRPIFQPSTTRH